jgi:hypothetical protein
LERALVSDLDGDGVNKIVVMYAGRVIVLGAPEESQPPPETPPATPPAQPAQQPDRARTLHKK